MWAIHHLWLDFEAEQFPDIPANRLVEMIERLFAYDGVLAARAAQQEQESGGTPGQPRDRPVDSSTASLAANFGDVMEVVTVQ